MDWQNVRKVLKSGYLMLLPILALAFYIAFIPHQNYPYPVHIDEWVNMAQSRAVIAAGSATFVEPFLGQSTLSLSPDLETGFHVFWAVFHQISGISWLSIFRYFPAIIFMMTVLSAYVLGRRQGFGWEAGFFTCLILTTVGIIGPGFLVAVAMGLLFIPLAIFLAFNFRSVWSYLTVFIFCCFLLTMHSPSAVCLVIILVPYVVLNLKGNFRHSLGLTLALAIPFLAPFPWIFFLLLSAAKEVVAPQAVPTYVDWPRLIPQYGYAPTLLGLLGTFVLAVRGEKRNYGFILGLLALLAMLATFFTLHRGQIYVYARGLMSAMLMIGLVAGAGLMWVKNIRLPEQINFRLKVPWITQNIGKVLCLALVGVTLATCIPIRQATPYYLMIDEQDYDAFVWIEHNITDDYEKAVLDPWKATAFTAITGKRVYTRIHEYPKTSDTKAAEFLRDGCSDTNFLRENGISIVYSRLPCDNPDLIEVRENIYLLKGAK